MEWKLSTILKILKGTGDNILIPRASGVDVVVTYLIEDSPATLSIVEVTQQKFCVSYFDKDWYFGIVSYVSIENSNGNIKFLHPKGPASKFFWSRKTNVCRIPDENVACEENQTVGQVVTSQLCPSTCSKYGVGSSFNKK